MNHFCNSQAVLLAAARRVGHTLTGKEIAMVIAISLIPLAIILFFTVYALRKEKKRSLALQEIANSLGFEFFPKGDSLYLAGLEGLALHTRGRNKKLRNLMRGKSQSFEVAIFDYSYVTGSGRSSRTWLQTVLCLQSATLKLPEFSVAPKRFWHMIGSLLGREEIEFDGHPIFSKVYVVRGNNPEAIRLLFTDEVLQFFEDHAGFSSEGTADRLLLFKSSKRPTADEIPAFLEDGLKLLSLVHTAG